MAIELEFAGSFFTTDSIEVELSSLSPQIEDDAAASDALGLEVSYSVELEDAAEALDAIGAELSQTPGEIHVELADVLDLGDVLEALLFDGNVHTVTSVTPERGRAGDTITIAGTGFAAANNSVRLDGASCTIATQATTEIVITQPTTFNVTNGFAVLQVNNFDNNRVTEVPFWVKDTIANLVTTALYDQEPGVEEFSASTPAAGGTGTVVGNPLRAEARMWERFATMLDYLLADTLTANGDMFVRDALGLAKLDGAAAGEDPGQRLVADSTADEGVRWGHEADCDFPYGRRIPLGTTTAVLMLANGTNDSTVSGQADEWPALLAGTIDAVYVYQQSDVANTDRLDRVRILVDGVQEYDSGAGLSISHRGKHFAGNLSVAVAADARIQLEITKTGTSQVMDCLGGVRMMTT